MPIFYILLLAILSLLPSARAKAQTPLTDAQIMQIKIPQLNSMADSCMRKADTINAIQYYIMLAGKYNDRLDEKEKRMCAKACASIGAIYFSLENYIPAFEFYLKSIQISESQNFTDILGECYNDIGNIYGVFEDLHQAIEHYQTALGYAEQTKDEDLKKKILMNLTGVSIMLNLNDQAKTYYTRMTKCSDKDSLQEYFMLFHKGLIKSIENKRQEAVADLLYAARYAKQKNMEPQFIATIYANLGNIYYECQNLDSALYYCSLNDEYTRQNNLKYYRQKNLKTYYTTCKAAGKDEEAYRLQDEYLTLSDSIFNQNEYNIMRKSQLAYEMNKSYKRIQSLTADQLDKQEQIRKQKYMLMLLAIGVLVFGAAFYMVWRQKRKLDDAYKDLFEKNRELILAGESHQHTRRQLQNQIEILKEDNGKLYEENLLLRRQNSIAATAEEADSCPQEEEKKNMTARINDSLKDTLQKNIAHIMEETTQYCDYNFSLEKLAAMVGSNSKYVSQIINETYGKNFRTFINEYRIREACKRLLDNDNFGSYTIKAIGESVGYKSHTNFTDLFKKITGIAPSIYQKLAKEKNTEKTPT